MQRHPGRSQLDSIGAVLAADIEAKGWLPIDLARRAGISHMTVGRYISGERRTPRTAKKIAKALGTPIKRYIVADQVAQADERIESGARSAEVSGLDGQLPKGSEDSSVEVGVAHEVNTTGVAPERPRELQSETTREATAEVSR